jgi:hypothetical protein
MSSVGKRSTSLFCDFVIRQPRSYRGGYLFWNWSQRLHLQQVFTFWIDLFLFRDVISNFFIFAQWQNCTLRSRFRIGICETPMKHLTCNRFIKFFCGMPFRHRAFSLQVWTTVKSFPSLDGYFSPEVLSREHPWKSFVFPKLLFRVARINSCFIQIISLICMMLYDVKKSSTPEYNTYSFLPEDKCFLFFCQIQSLGSSAVHCLFFFFSNWENRSIAI